MVQPRRYVFHGNASGVAAHIRRPVDFLLPVQAASSLPVTGGLSESKAGPFSRPERRATANNAATDYITFESAATRAHGDYVDQEQAVAMTFGKLGFDEGESVTTVSAEVRGLVAIGRVKVGTAALTLQAFSSDLAEPPIRCESAVLDDVSVDGYPVNITLDQEFFYENDTMSKLSAAAVEGKYPQYFFDAGTAARYGFYNFTGMVKVTLVNSIEWAGDPHPNATIDGNAIIIPEFGKVYFAEMYVSSNSRRLTMVRFQFGSDDGGDGSAASGDVNGSPWPPTGP